MTPFLGIYSRETWTAVRRRTTTHGIQAYKSLEFKWTSHVALLSESSLLLLLEAVQQGANPASPLIRSPVTQREQVRTFGTPGYYLAQFDILSALV